MRRRAHPCNRRSVTTLLLAAAVSASAVTNPSENMAPKTPSGPKKCVTAAAPRCEHLGGFVDDTCKMEARPLAGMRPASGCGSIQRGNLEALSGVFTCSHELPFLHASRVHCDACCVSHSVCSRSNDQRAASTSCTFKDLVVVLHRSTLVGQQLLCSAARRQQVDSRALHAAFGTSTVPCC